MEQQPHPPETPLGPERPPNAPSRQRSPRKLWRWALALTVLAFVLYKLGGDRETLRRVASTPPRTLAVLAVLCAASQGLLSLRLSLAVAQAGGAGVPQRVWLRLIAVGQLLNLIAPQLGGVYRAVALKREHGVPYGSYASGLLVFAWLDLVLGALLASVAIFVLQPGLQLGAMPVLPVLIAAVATLAVAPFAAGRLLSLYPGRQSFVARARAKAATVFIGVGAALKAPAFLLRYLLLTVVVTLEQVTTIWLLFRALGADLPLSTLLLFQVAFKVSTQVALTPANLGITELLFGLLSYAADFTLEQGIAVSLLYRAVSTTMVAVLGVGWGGARLVGSAKSELTRYPPSDLDAKR
jgi:uncharacterized membrane protein YbhN (UPF0104 family)